MRPKFQGIAPENIACGTTIAYGYTRVLIPVDPTSMLVLPGYKLPQKPRYDPKSCNAEVQGLDETKHGITMGYRIPIFVGMYVYLMFIYMFVRYMIYDI